MGTIQDQINSLRQSIVTSQTQIDSLTRQLCQVSGTLFNDSDGDGMRDAGEGASGVRKVLLQPGNITVSSDADGNYAITGLDPGSYLIARPDFPSGYRLSNPSTPGGSAIALTLAAGEHRTVDIGTTNRPVAKTTTAPPLIAVEVGALTSDSPKWAAVGACITLATSAKDDPTAIATVALAQSLGLTHLRAFGPSCKIGGALDAGYINPVRRLTSRGLRVVMMHGAPESDPTHTTYDESDWKRYFDAVAVARNGNALYEIELQNEFNLTQYWPLGGGAALSAAAVAKLIAIAKIARAALGPAAVIIGPSIGYGASTTPHLQYQKALLDAGLLDSVSAINTHFYFASPQQIADVLGPYREWVGPAAKIYATETNCPATVANFAAAAPAFVSTLWAGGVVPMIYRLVPRGDSSWDNRCLFDVQNAKNAPVTAAWLT